MPEFRTSGGQRASQFGFRGETFFVGTGAPAVDFAANWSNLPGFNLAGLHYWKDEQGVCYMQGTIRRAPSGTTLGETILTLPEEFRPKSGEDHFFPGLIQGNAIMGFGIIGSSGILYPNYTGVTTLAVMHTFWLPGHERTVPR